MVGNNNIYKCDQIINKIKSHTQLKNMNYGIKNPMTLTEAEQLDMDNNNDLRRNAIEKEIKGVQVAFNY